MYEQLVNQNEIAIKKTATKEDLNNLEGIFERKIDKISNELLEHLQNPTAKTFRSAEINQSPNSDDGNENKCTHETELLNDKVQSLEKEKQFPKKRIS